MAVVSKTMARATVVPVAEMTGSYVGALWYTCLTCFFSTLVGVILIILSDDPKEALVKQQQQRTRAHNQFTNPDQRSRSGDGVSGQDDEEGESISLCSHLPPPPALLSSEVMEKGQQQQHHQGMYVFIILLLALFA